MLVVFRAFDAPAIAVETEAVIAIACGWVVFGLVAYALPRALRRTTRAERMLAATGQTAADYNARRAVHLAEDARTRLAQMQQAAQGRTEPLRAALDDLDSRMTPLLHDMIANPDTARRADDLLRRTLPRVQSSLTDYCAFAARGDGVIDTNETRARMIAALQATADRADQARRASVETAQDDVDVSLTVLESTLAHPR